MRGGGDDEEDDDADEGEPDNEGVEECESEAGQAGLFLCFAKADWVLPL